MLVLLQYAMKKAHGIYSFCKNHWSGNLLNSSKLILLHLQKRCKKNRSLGGKMVGKLKCFACRQSNNPKYSFPISDKEALKKWLRYLKIRNRTPKKSSRLCKDHFNPRKVIQQNVLKSKSNLKNVKQQLFSTLFKCLWHLFLFIFFPWVIL